MKILFFTRRFAPDIGGVETHVREVAKRLIKEGHTVTIMTERTAGSQQTLSDKSIDSATSATVYRIPIVTNESQKKFTIWSWLWKHRDLITDADVIHAHDVFFWFLPFRLAYPHKKIYTTFHGYETIYPPQVNAIRIRKLSAKLSRGNIAVGNYIKKWYGTYPDFVTYGGFSDKKVSENAHQSNNLSNTKKPLHILFIGRIEEDNAVSKYAELFDLLKKNKVRYTFTAIGDGSQKNVFTHYGDTPGFAENVLDYVAKADVVFASSYLSMLDSMLQRKLVVSLYTNPLKHDYLSLSPFAKFAIVESSAEKAYQQIKFYTLNHNRLQTVLHDEHAWASKQSWDEVTKLYLKLWQK